MASAVSVKAAPVAEAELDEKGQWKGMEEDEEVTDPVASAVSVKAVPVAESVAEVESDENGQWKGMEEEAPVPDEVGPGPW